MLFQLRAVFERVSDLFPQADVSGRRGIEDDGVQLFVVHAAVRQDALVGADVDDLADHVAVLIAFQELAFQRQGQLIDDRGVDKSAFFGRKAVNVNKNLSQVLANI